MKEDQTSEQLPQQPVSQTTTPPTPAGTAPQPLASQQPPITPYAPPRRRRKGLLIGGILAGALVLLGGGGALAYNLWYQNPDKVVHDAIVNMIKAKTIQGTGNFVVSSDDYKITVKTDGRSDSASGLVNVEADFEFGSDAAKFALKLHGSGMYKDDVFYVKLGGVREIFDTFAANAEDIDTRTKNQIIAVIDKIDDKWISIKASDYEDVSKEVSEQQACISRAMKTLSQDESVERELVDLYKANQIVQVVNQLDTRDGSFGYEIELDRDKAAAFVEGIADTTYGKSMKECDDSIDFKEIAESVKKADLDGSSKPRVRMELWVSRFGHEITEFSVKVEDDTASAEFVTNPEFNKDVTIEAPSDAISLKDLMADIEKIIQSYSADMYAPQDDPYAMDSEFSFN